MLKTVERVDCQITPEVDDLKARLMRDGVVMIEPEDGLFTPEEWDVIERQSTHAELPLETVVIGDAGEPNLVQVGRLMTDVDRPRVVNHPIAQPVLDLLGSPARMRFFAQMIDASDLYMRRAQINKMPAGSFIGVHVDQDSNPDYRIAIVLQLGTEFAGGEFAVHRPDGSSHSVVPGYRSITISHCDWAHEVRTVHSGIRTSLVFFVADHAAENRRSSVFV